MHVCDRYSRDFLVPEAPKELKLREGQYRDEVWPFGSKGGQDRETRESKLGGFLLGMNQAVNQAAPARQLTINTTRNPTTSITPDRTKLYAGGAKRAQ